MQRRRALVGVLIAAIAALAAAVLVPGGSEDPDFAALEQLDISDLELERADRIYRSMSADLSGGLPSTSSRATIVHQYRPHHGTTLTSLLADIEKELQVRGWQVERTPAGLQASRRDIDGRTTARVTASEHSLRDNIVVLSIRATSAEPGTTPQVWGLSRTVLPGPAG